MERRIVEIWYWTGTLISWGYMLAKIIETQPVMSWFLYIPLSFGIALSSWIYVGAILYEIISERL